MRIFISYRRDDTAGRAGRLFDVLVSRLGERHVFQDVAAIVPGTDFTQRVADAIAKSDAVLAVIGSEWLTIRGADGTRRLDEPGDYVRGEIGAALAAEVPVVPVLVGDAELPASSDLPEELRPLVNRQAARIRDDSWHQDVDALVRRLEGEAVVKSPRRRWPLLAGSVTVIVALAVLGWLWRNRDGDDDDGGDSGAREPPPCGGPDESWQPIGLATNPTGEGTDHVARTFVATVEEANYRAQRPATTIVVRLRLEITTDSGDESGFFIAPSDIDALYVDGVSIGSPTCFSASPRNLKAGESAELLIGFEGPYEPGSPLVLATNVADMDVTVAGG
jgi:TIR domain